MECILGMGRCDKIRPSPTPDFHILIPGTCASANLHGKGALQMEMKRLGMERLSG